MKKKLFVTSLVLMMAVNMAGCITIRIPDKESNEETSVEKEDTLDDKVAGFVKDLFNGKEDDKTVESTEEVKEIEVDDATENEIMDIINNLDTDVDDVNDTEDESKKEIEVDEDTENEIMDIINSLDTDVDFETDSEDETVTYDTYGVDISGTTVRLDSKIDINTLRNVFGDEEVPSEGWYVWDNLEIGTLDDIIFDISINEDYENGNNKYSLNGVKIGDPLEEAVNKLGNLSDNNNEGIAHVISTDKKVKFTLFYDEDEIGKPLYTLEASRNYE